MTPFRVCIGRVEIECPTVDDVDVMVRRFGKPHPNDAATIAALRFALKEACDIGKRHTGETDEDHIRLEELARIAEGGGE